jgi:Zn-dependent protease
LPGIEPVRIIVAIIVILLISIDLHELAHALVATALGDPTPRRNGQLSLNPFVHMDQVGVVLLVISSLFGYGFTYGRTLINPQALRFGPQKGGALVAAAGPATNLLLACAVGVALRIAYVKGCAFSSDMADYLSLALYVNCILFALNLLPIPPLDGFRILAGFLTPGQMYSLTPLIQYGPMLLLVFLLFSSFQSGPSPIQTVGYHIASWIYPFPIFTSPNAHLITC